MANFSIRTHEWASSWAGPWSILTCSYIGDLYTTIIRETVEQGLEHALFISHKGFTKAYVPKIELEQFWNSLASQVVANEAVALQWCGELKAQANSIRTLLGIWEKNPVGKKEYTAFLRALYAYTVPHVKVKNVTNRLPIPLQTKLLPYFTEARVYTEPVYTETELFMRHMADQVAAQTKYAPEHILCLTKAECTGFWQNGTLPEVSKLMERYTGTALLVSRGTDTVMVGEDVHDIEAFLHQDIHTREIRGTGAYRGKVEGRVRLVFNPEKVNDFEDGDILVTGMTRPEYVPLMRKSGAIVTDAGGMLCHAAIVARELQKPCVIGTEHATKVLKDGDIVEVDADTGIVRKI